MSSTSTPTRRAAATSSCSAATGSPAWCARTGCARSSPRASRLRSAVDALVAEANEMGGRDNITVVAVPGRRRRATEPATTARAVDETVVGLRRRPEPDTGEQDVVPAPAAPEPREPAPRAAAHRRRRAAHASGASLVALVVLAVLAGAVVGAVAGFAASTSSGQDDRGLVTLYRGRPRTSCRSGSTSTRPQYVSSVPARTLSPYAAAPAARPPAALARGRRGRSCASSSGAGSERAQPRAARACSRSPLLITAGFTAVYIGALRATSARRRLTYGAIFLGLCLAVHLFIRAHAAGRRSVPVPARARCWRRSAW